MLAVGEDGHYLVAEAVEFSLMLNETTGAART